MILSNSELPVLFFDTTTQETLPCTTLVLSRNQLKPLGRRRLESSQLRPNSYPGPQRHRDLPSLDHRHVSGQPRSSPSDGLLLASGGPAVLYTIIRTSPATHVEVPRRRSVTGERYF